MKKNLKIILIILGTIIGIILLDSIQAFVFDNNPIIKIKEYYDGGDIKYKSKGILVDTVNCVNGIRDTQIKGFSHSCNYMGGNYILVDKTKETKDFSCAEALEEFYEDDNYIYYWNCIKNKYMVVKYSDGTEETISQALLNGHIDIQILDKFNISYIKYVKEKNRQENTILIKENNNQNLVLVSNFNGNHSIYYYSLDSAKISLNNVEYDLADAISKSKINIEKITNNMDLKGTFYDGGSKMYTTKPNVYSYSGYYYNILVCNTIDGNNDIYIGPAFGNNELKYQSEFCK